LPNDTEYNHVKR